MKHALITFTLAFLAISTFSAPTYSDQLDDLTPEELSIMHAAYTSGLMKGSAQRACGDPTDTTKEINIPHLLSEECEVMIHSLINRIEEIVPDCLAGVMSEKACQHYADFDYFLGKVYTAREAYLNLNNSSPQATSAAST